MAKPIPIKPPSQENDDERRRREFKEEIGWLLADREVKPMVKRIIAATASYIEAYEGILFEVGKDLGSESNSFTNVIPEEFAVQSLAAELSPKIEGHAGRANRIADKVASMLPHTAVREFDLMRNDWDIARYHSVDAGYLIGLIVGARMAGYPVEKLERGLVRSIMAEPRRISTVRAR